MTAVIHRSAPHALSETESAILSAASASLGLPLSPEHVLEPLSLLGADSLGIAELAAAIEQASGVALPQGLAHESATIRELATWVDARRTAAPDDPAEADPFAQMLDDSRLPDDVRPGAAAAEEGLEDGRAILLTGATGFLGASLAGALLARSEATLYCAVRGGPEAGSQRLRRRLIENGVSSDTIAARVQVVDADLTRPHLGLDADHWARLGGTIDRVLHAGASVSWVSSYASLRPANVLGTLELLRLASRRAAIPFHFVSSLSVCYAADGPAQVDEAFDPLPHLRGIHLGYAQTKIVAEALVREAGRRGLPIKIYRPSLISGHSRTGAFNPDDLLSFLIRGCVRMGTAPDLDWSLDCLPVDTVAGAILSLSRGGTPTAHLMHDRPRHWRECLLWMRLAGYRVRLVPYSEWLQQLARDTLESADHPLRPLRPLFQNRPARGLTLPELYEDGRRSRATADQTDGQLADSGRRPALDASLLERYFAAYRAAGHLPPPADGVGRPPVPSTTDFDEAFFEGALAARGQVVRIRAATCLTVGSPHSIISELTAWRCGQTAGVFRYRLDIETTSGRETRDVILKLKPHADEATAVGEALARLCDARAGDAYARWSDRVGLAGSHLRERALYETAGGRLASHMPALLGVADLDARGGCALIIEDVSGAAMIDSVDRTPWWDPRHIESAITGLAQIHADWHGRTAGLRELPWAGFIQSTHSMSAMSDLWRALAEHAAPAFGRWGGGELPGLHRYAGRLDSRVAADPGRWAAHIDSQRLQPEEPLPQGSGRRSRPVRLRLGARDARPATAGSGGAPVLRAAGQCTRRDPRILG